MERASRTRETVPCAAQVERLALENEDLDSIGLRIHRVDGTSDVWLVRLTPPTQGYEAALPLAQPELAPVSTADGAYSLDGHAGVIKELADGRRHKIVVGGAAYIDGEAAAAGVYEGVVTGLEGTVDDEGFAFVADAGLPDGDALRGTWIQIALGSYAPTTTSAGHDVQNDVRDLFEIDRVDCDAESCRVRLAQDPKLTWTDQGIFETVRPGRTFGGPNARSYRVVVAAHTYADAPAPNPTPTPTPRPTPPPTVVPGDPSAAPVFAPTAPPSPPPSPLSTSATASAAARAEDDEASLWSSIKPKDHVNAIFVYGAMGLLGGVVLLILSGLLYYLVVLQTTETFEARQSFAGTLELQNHAPSRGSHNFRSGTNPLRGHAMPSGLSGAAAKTPHVHFAEATD